MPQANKADRVDHPGEPGQQRRQQQRAPAFGPRRAGALYRPIHGLPPSTPLPAFAAARVREHRAAICAYRRLREYPCSRAVRIPLRRLCRLGLPLSLINVEIGVD